MKRILPNTGTPITRVTPGTAELSRGEAAALRRCAIHPTPADCRAARDRLARVHEARRQSALAIDAHVWLHARRRWDAIPHRPFLERWDPGGRWRDGSLPAAGLARAAVLYHLPWEGTGTRTLADRFADSAEAKALCLAERAWLDAERKARFSFFRVGRLWDSGRVSVRDVFAPRGDDEIVLGALDVATPAPAWREVLFARIVEIGGTHAIDLGQVRGARACGIRDSAMPVRHVRRLGRDLRRHAELVTALFEAWELEEFPEGAEPSLPL